MRCGKYRQVCHLMENCDDHGVGEQGLGEVSVSFMERCNGNVGGVEGCAEV